MFILAMEIQLSLPYAQSLKDKRAIRQSLMTKLKNKFSVSVRETKLQDNIQELFLSTAFVCLTATEGEQYAQQIEYFVDGFSLTESCIIKNIFWDIEVGLIS